jgi:hypothetical protein
MKTLLEIVSEKLESLQHYPPDEGIPILAQLMNHLVYNQETAGDDTKLELTVLTLMTHSVKTVHHYLFSADPEGKQEQWMATLLNSAITEDEIYEVMIDNLLQIAMTEWEEPEL